MLWKNEDNMTQKERLLYLIRELLGEQPRCADMQIPASEREQKDLLRSLFNIRQPKPAGKDFLAVQDAYLREETEKKGITDLADLTPCAGNIYLWRGDITTLRCDAIVNAANSRLLGCFCPCHGCIDNAIHTFAGVQLRLACMELMQRQGHEEETGKAKITPAFNLPCRYVLHTVGPIIQDMLREKDRELLASCYRSCLELADSQGIKSIAFCCISTGEFCFPNDIAANIAVSTVKNHIRKNHSEIKVIFNVFKKVDYEIYRKILRSD